MTCDAVGGVWQYARELAGALAPLGVETVLAVLGPGDVPEVDGVEVLRTGLPLDWLADGPDAVLAAGTTIAELAHARGADVVHINSPALAAARFALPVVAVAHGCVGTWWQAAHSTTPDPAYRWHGELMHAGLIAADAAVAPSASFAATLQRHYHLPFLPAAVHNGRTAPALPVTAVPAAHVFTAGRLWDRVKATALLDRVAARLPLRAAGPLTGPHGETVAVDHLTALGVLDEAALAAELAARPVFVSAATFEPFGLAVLEAAQAGCALVLSGIDTFRELWTGAALIVPEQDDAAYVAAIERVLGDPALRAHLGEAAAVRAARYTPAATATAMAAIYAGVARGERAAA